MKTLEIGDQKKEKREEDDSAAGLLKEAPCRLMRRPVDVTVS